jgi:hypothetical protein
VAQARRGRRVEARLEAREERERAGGERDGGEGRGEAQQREWREGGHLERLARRDRARDVDKGRGRERSELGGGEGRRALGGEGRGRERGELGGTQGRRALGWEGRLGGRRRAAAASATAARRGRLAAAAAGGGCWAPSCMLGGFRGCNGASRARRERRGR